MEYTIEAPVIPLFEQGYPQIGVIELELGSRKDHCEVLEQFAGYFKSAITVRHRRKRETKNDSSGKRRQNPFCHIKTSF